MCKKVYINARYKTEFSAVLKAENGRVLEYGTGLVDTLNGSVDFKAEFVPLFQMGERVVIVRTFGPREIHRFYGAVYLSSEKLLRITSVTDELVEGSETVFLFPITLSAQAELVREEPAEEPRRLFRRKNREKNLFDVTVNTLTIDSVEFSTPELIPDGPQVFLNIEEPVSLGRIPVAVDRRLAFGESGNSYFCSIEEMPSATWERWEQFIRDLHLQNNKLF